MLFCALGNGKKCELFWGGPFREQCPLMPLSLGDPFLSQMPPKLDVSREQFFQAPSPQIKERMEAG